MHDKKNSLTFDAAQHKLDDWISQFEEGYFPALSQLARLTEELGELARAVSYAQGIKTPKEGEIVDEVIDEFGDMLLVMTCFANAHNISMAEAFQKSFEKVDARDKTRWRLKVKSP